MKNTVRKTSVVNVIRSWVEHSLKLDSIMDGALEFLQFRSLTTANQPIFTCLKSTTKTPEKYVKSVLS